MDIIICEINIWMAMFRPDGTEGQHEKGSIQKGESKSNEKYVSKVDDYC